MRREEGKGKKERRREGERFASSFRSYIQ